MENSKTEISPTISTGNAQAGGGTELPVVASFASGPAFKGLRAMIAGRHGGKAELIEQASVNILKAPERPVVTVAAFMSSI